MRKIELEEGYKVLTMCVHYAKHNHTYESMKEWNNAYCNSVIERFGEEELEKCWHYAKRINSLD